MSKINYGYMGKVLWVDLDNHTHYIEKIDDEIYREYLTGYGLGVKLIFDNLPTGTDPLSKDNILGFMSGILTGTKAFFTGRYSVIGKSPLTGTWGDSNSGGHFAPAIKAAGFDGILFKGKSKEPVYLLINGGEISFKNTTYIDDNGNSLDLWGQDSVFTDNYLKAKHGSKYRVSCIGPSGEQQSLISGIVTDGGRLAARSGLGAVMGSKNLKALCICGTEDVKVFDQEIIIENNKIFAEKFKDFKNPVRDYLESLATTTTIGSEVIHYLSEKGKFNPPPEIDRYILSHWGTPGVVSFSVEREDSPVKNWMGTGMKDFPASRSSRISSNAVTDLQEKKYGCYCCPLRCGGEMKDTDGKYSFSNSHKPEYETLCGFGTLLQSDQLENIVLINDKLNRAGMDSISSAMTVAWVYELVHNDLIDQDKLDNVNIKWKDNSGAVKLIDQMITGNGIGKYLRNGIKKALEDLVDEGYITSTNKNRAKECGMTVQGQELPMHDPRKVNIMGVGLGIAYEAEPTPGRHTSSLPGADAYVNEVYEPKKKTSHLHPLRNNTNLPPKSEIGNSLIQDSCFMDLINGLGLCAFGLGGDVKLPLMEYIYGATGWDYDFDYYMKCAQRIKTLRHSFNIREGIDVKNIRLPERIRTGIEDYEGHTFDEVKTMYFQAMGYDLETLKPTKETLKHLGLNYVIDAIYKD